MMLQSLWDFSWHFCNGNEFMIFTLYSTALITVVYLLLNIPFLIIDFVQPAWVQQYKIQGKKYVTWQKYSSTFPLIAFNTTVVAASVSTIFYVLGKYTGVSFSREVPSLLIILRDLIFSVLIEELGFYYTHRLFHQPFFYKRIHKIHHRWTAPVSITSVYCHPLEHAISNLMPIMLGPTLIGAHMITMTEGTKLVLPAGQAPTEIEKQIAGSLTDLENSKDLRGQLRELYIVGVKEIDHGNKKIVVVYVPFPQLKLFNKIQVQLIRELEKKLGGKHVVFIAKRRILPKPQRGNKRIPEKQKRPRSRTLTAVHEAILEDICFPAEIVGKRIRVKSDGKRIIKCHLDKQQQTNVEHKVDTFTHVYKKLTGKDVTFEFPDPLLLNCFC
ncbi:unnamed protein product, partial [Mesorhabditis spiculigera]